MRAWNYSLCQEEIGAALYGESCFVNINRGRAVLSGLKIIKNSQASAARASGQLLADQSQPGCCDNCSLIYSDGRRIIALNLSGAILVGRATGSDNRLIGPLLLVVLH